MSHEDTLRSLRQRRDAIVSKLADAKARKEALQRELNELTAEARDKHGIKDIKKLPQILKESEEALKQQEEDLAQKIEGLEAEVLRYEEQFSD